MPLVLLENDGRGVATVTLNRPERGNAYNEELLGELITGLQRLAADEALRALTLRGAGKHFQAGADIDWLAQAATYPPDRNYAAAMASVRAMKLLNEFPRPVIAVVHGGCFGGGCGMVCCADVALATPDAMFGLTEVRVGVAPTPISTHMVHAIGLRQTRRYALTGERFGAEEAARIGLVHEVVQPERMETRVAEILDAILLGAPGAVVATKRSFLGANRLVLDERAMAMLAFEGAAQRGSQEGREGTTAFREKRRPMWAVASSDS
jgi:methylglutaconyl-CoA hydratase